jgi:hypothetical protein
VGIFFHDEVHPVGDGFDQPLDGFGVRYCGNGSVFPGHLFVIGIDILDVREHGKDVERFSDIALDPVSGIEIPNVFPLLFDIGTQGWGDFFDIPYRSPEIGFRMSLKSVDVPVFRAPPDDSFRGDVFDERHDPEVPFGLEKIEAHIAAPGENAGEFRVRRVIGESSQNLLEYGAIVFQFLDFAVGRRELRRSLERRDNPRGILIGNSDNVCQILLSKAYSDDPLVQISRRVFVRNLPNHPRQGGIVVGIMHRVRIREAASEDEQAMVQGKVFFEKRFVHRIFIIYGDDFHEFFVIIRSENPTEEREKLTVGKAIVRHDDDVLGVARESFQSFQFRDEFGFCRFDGFLGYDSGIVIEIVLHKFSDIFEEHIADVALDFAGQRRIEAEQLLIEGVVYRISLDGFFSDVDGVSHIGTEKRGFWNFRRISKPFPDKGKGRFFYRISIL